MAFPDLLRPSDLRFLLGPLLPQNQSGFQGAHIIGNNFGRGKQAALAGLMSLVSPTIRTISTTASSSPKASAATQCWGPPTISAIISGHLIGCFMMLILRRKQIRNYFSMSLKKITNAKSTPKPPNSR
jgi:hypothetical protein